MVANGLWDQQHLRPRLWEQSAKQVEGERIWQEWRRKGKTVAMLFWQQALGEEVDIVLSPAPIHKHHGGMIQDCYCQPKGLYENLCQKIGRRFDLMHYWGPMASSRSSSWIAEATALLLADAEYAPDLCLTYLPALDYDLQRFGTKHKRSRRALQDALGQLGLLKRAAEANGYDLIIFGDYAIADVTGGPVLPNLALRNAGLLNVRHVRDMSYPDFYTSAAFAVADHEVAHLYIQSGADVDKVRDVLATMPGVAEVIEGSIKAEMGIDHSNAGELILLADEGSWFAYPWWDDNCEAPDYASHVDIHNKPGYDPCELFWGWPPGSVSQNMGRVKGTHGRAGIERQTAWTTTMPLAWQAMPDLDCKSLLDIAAACLR